MKIGKYKTDLSNNIKLSITDKPASVGNYKAYCGKVRLPMCTEIYRDTFDFVEANDTACNFTKLPMCAETYNDVCDNTINIPTQNVQREAVHAENLQTLHTSHILKPIAHTGHKDYKKSKKHF